MCSDLHESNSVKGATIQFVIAQTLSSVHSMTLHSMQIFKCQDQLYSLNKSINTTVNIFTFVIYFNRF